MWGVCFNWEGRISRGVGRREGPRKRGRQARPPLLSTLLTTPSGQKNKIGDLAPDLPNGPLRDPGTSSFGVPTSNGASSTKIRTHPPKQRHIRQMGMPLVARNLTNPN